MERVYWQEHHGLPPGHEHKAERSGEAVQRPVGERELHILRHSLGVGRDGRGQPYRNHFVTGPGSDDYEACCALVAKGLMFKRTGNELTGGDPCFVVSASGEVIARQQ